MIEGIVLAGGKSTRAKTNKMLLNIKGKPLIFHTIDSLKNHIDHIIVVTGRYDQEIREALKDRNDIEIIYNPIYELGMFTSVKQGVRATTNDFFIIPGDFPFISSNTFSQLSKGKKLIRVPTYLNEDGHPIFISQLLKEALLHESDNSNLRIFKSKYDVERIPVDDPFILTDIDTIEDYKNVLKRKEITICE